MTTEHANTTRNTGDVSAREIKLLLVYRSAPAWKKKRLDTLAALMARVMRPDDADQLYGDIARLFKDAPPTKALKSIMQEAWQCIHRSRIARGLE